MTVVELTVGNSSNRTLHYICGSLAFASSLMLDSRFSTLLKCSAHLFKIASLFCEKSASICTEQCGGSSGSVPKLGLDCHKNVAVGCFLGY